MNKSFSLSTFVLSKKAEREDLLMDNKNVLMEKMPISEITRINIQSF